MSPRARLAALVWLAALAACSPRAADGPPPAPQAVRADSPPPARPPTKLEPKQDNGVLVFEEADHDFGEVREGEEVKHAFGFTNSGAEAVTISKVHASCGCTAALASAETIAPGASGEIAATFKTRGHPGRANKTVTVYSSDPETPQRTLSLKGWVRADAELDPFFLNWGPIREGAGRTDRVRLRLQPGVEASGAASSSPTLKADIVEEGGETFLRVALSPDARRGPMAERVTVRTTSEIRPELLLAVNARILGDVEVSPEAISFGAVRLGAQETRTVRIQHLDGKPFKVTSVTATSPTILVELAPQESPAAYEILVKNAVAAAPGPLRGQVEIRTDLPKDAAITVPIFGANAPP